MVIQVTTQIIKYFKLEKGNIFLCSLQTPWEEDLLKRIVFRAAFSGSLRYCCVNGTNVIY